MSGDAYKQILIATKENHSIDIPERFFGKKIEVIIQEAGRPIPPPGKKIDVEKLFENFGEAPDFPSIEEIRGKA